MHSAISLEAKRDLLKRGFTRRGFGRIATLLAAGSTLPFYNEAALAQFSMAGPLPDDAVRLNANENPLGPCREACEAMDKAVRQGGRYMYEQADVFAETLAAAEGIDASYVMPFAGSSDPLHRIVLAYTSPTRSLVTANPGYEAAGRAARYAGATVHEIPLRADYAHDVKKMLAADSSAGVFYVCTPNNPTGTVTPRADIEFLVANKPAGSIVLVDEAYLHFTTERPCIDLVVAGKDVIVLRTFSKLYGMAGLRAGAAIGRPDLLAKIRLYAAGALPLTGMIGAIASLKVKNLVAERRKYVQENRDDLCAYLKSRGVPFVPSVSNKVMVDVGRPGREVASALAAEKVYVGRVWSALPTHLRVTIGTPEEMAAFKKAFVKVTSV